jgi:hypothetical protein
MLTALRINLIADWLSVLIADWLSDFPDSRLKA